MKSICVALLLALGVAGCSHSNERAYSKYLARSNAAKEKNRQKLIKQQRAQMPKYHPKPSDAEENVQYTNPDAG